MAKMAWCGLVGALLAVNLFPARSGGAETAKPKDPQAAARWSDLTPLALHAQFASVRYPHLGEGGIVTFIADDAYAPGSKGKGPNHGIFRYGADGSLVCLVRDGETTIPGSAATLSTIQGLQMDENGVDFVFNSYDTAKGRGLYHWSKGKLRTVARTGKTILPGDTEPITGVEYCSLCGGRLLYKANSPGLGVALVLQDAATGEDRVLCHGGMAIPGRKDETFQFIGNTNWVTPDSVIFRAASTDKPREADNKGTSGIYGWFGIKDWSAKGGELAPEKLCSVVDGTVYVPIKGVPKEDTFDNIGNAPISGSTAVFDATGEHFDGIFAARTPDGPIRCVASNHTEFDGLLKGHFTSFGSYPAVNGPNVIFTAQAAEGPVENENEDEDDDGADDAKGNDAPKEYVGVFIYRLDRGEMFTLTDSRALLDGKEVESYEIGGHFMVGDRFAVAVTFKDKTSQIFLGTIRPEAYRRLTDGPPVAAKKAPPAP